MTPAGETLSLWLWAESHLMGPVWILGLGIVSELVTRGRGSMCFTWLDLGHMPMPLHAGHGSSTESSEIDSPQEESFVHRRKTGTVGLAGWLCVCRLVDSGSGRVGLVSTHQSLEWWALGRFSIQLPPIRVSRQVKRYSKCGRLNVVKNTHL